MRNIFKFLKNFFIFLIKKKQQQQQQHQKRKQVRFLKKSFDGFESKIVTLLFFQTQTPTNSPERNSLGSRSLFGKS